MSTVASASKAGQSQPNLSKPALPRRLLRVREAAQYLSVSPWKLRRLVQDGLLPIVQADLDAFIERNKRQEPF